MIPKQRNMSSIYISKGNKMLLLYRQGGRVVNNVWIGSAGGHFEECELNNAKACVLRELYEELSINEDQLENLKLRYITLRRTKNEIRLNYFFFADLKDNIDEAFVSNEGVAEWFDYSKLKALDMSFSSGFVVRHYLDTGINNDMIYGGIADGEKVVFTALPEF